MTIMLNIVSRSTGILGAANKCWSQASYGTGRVFRSQVEVTFGSHLFGPTGAFIGRGALFSSMRSGASRDTPNGTVAKDVPTSPKVDDPDAKLYKGKYPGLGLPKAVGQPEDLPCIEFGKPTGMYNFVRHQHGDPRAHLMKDGRYKERYDTEAFHWYDAYTDVPKQKFTIVNGETMIMGKETRPMEELFGVEQTNIPFTPRRRLNLWGNHNIILKAEYCFFWIPTFIIFSLAVPCYTMIYMMDEAVDTTMTVKVIGHQWYWVYEVESPPLVE